MLSATDITSYAGSIAIAVPELGLTPQAGIVFDGAGVWVSSPNANKLGKF